MVVSEIDMVGLLPWVMGFLIGMGAGYRQDRCDGFLKIGVVVVEISAVFFFFLVVLVVGFSWWLLM